MWDILVLNALNNQADQAALPKGPYSVSIRIEKDGELVEEHKLEGVPNGKIEVKLEQAAQGQPEARYIVDFSDLPPLPASGRSDPYCIQMAPPKK